MASVSERSALTKEKKERKRSKKSEVDGDTQEARPKERKRKENKTDVAEVAVDDIPSSSEKPKKRKRKQLETDAATENSNPEITHEESNKKKRKKRKGEDTSETNADLVEAAEGETSNKFSKRKVDVQEDGTESAAETSSKKRPEKETKNKSKKEKRKENAASSLPNPGEDTELTDKARGALSYAYTRISSPGSWKFNKAHQNWIVKHFFTPDAVPEKYLPSVVGYLAGCQGGVRENLIKSCNKQLEPVEEIPEPSLAPTQDTAPADQSTTPAENITAAPVVPKPDVVVLSPEMQEIMKTRARVLLKALGITVI